MSLARLKGNRGFSWDRPVLLSGKEGGLKKSFLLGWSLTPGKWVSPKGIGSLLMERSIDRAWRLGVRTIDLAVRAENPQALGIYTRFGFQTIPEQTILVLLNEI